MHKRGRSTAAAFLFCHSDVMAAEAATHDNASSACELVADFARAVLRLSLSTLRFLAKPAREASASRGAFHAQTAALKGTGLELSN